jgi:mono/diheme cytochrome c family protein
MSRSLKAIAIALGAAALIGGGTMLAAQTSQKPAAATAAKAKPEKFGVGRAAKPEEIAGWDIDVRPDGHGLPAGKGTVRDGEAIYNERCASCHGEFGESAGRWPMLAGGAGSLASHDPVRTVGSYWPYASTVLDYIRRAMPFGDAQSLTNDELYAVTAYVFYLNDVIKDEDFELSDRNFASIKLPNERQFMDDDREVAEKAFWNDNPCMKDCAPGPAKIIGHARVLDVTPEAGTAPKVD